MKTLSHMIWRMMHKFMSLIVNLGELKGKSYSCLFRYSVFSPGSYKYFGKLVYWSILRGISRWNCKKYTSSGFLTFWVSQNVREQILELRFTKIMNIKMGMRVSSDISTYQISIKLIPPQIKMKIMMKQIVEKEILKTYSRDLEIVLPRYSEKRKSSRRTQGSM